MSVEDDRSLPLMASHCYITGNFNRSGHHQVTYIERQKNCNRQITGIFDCWIKLYVHHWRNDVTWREIPYPWWTPIFPSNCNYVPFILIAAICHHLKPMMNKTWRDISESWHYICPYNNSLMSDKTRIQEQCDMTYQVTCLLTPW